MKKGKILVLLSISLIQYYSANSQSVFSTGNWYKLSLSTEGIYCITYSDLVSLGINVLTIDPRNISIYANKAGMLPVTNSVSHPGDPKEISIEVKGESDGHFDPADSIFFYGQSQDVRTANQNNSRFSHIKNIYSDSTYYFLTIKNTPGKRIQQIVNLPTFTDSTNTYNEFLWHENDSVNIMHSGQKWFGEIMNPLNNQRNFSFDVSHALQTSYIHVHIEYATHTVISGTIASSCGGVSNTRNALVNGTSIQDPVAYTLIDSLNLPPSSSGLISSTWTSADPTSYCYLDFMELNFRSNLESFKPQQIFCDLNSVGPGNITRYQISNANISNRIWNVSDPLNVSDQQYQTNSNSIEFNANNDSVQTYFLFDAHTFLRPVFSGQIPNQNLHSITTGENLIISADEYITQANTLGSFHTTHDGLQTVVVTTSQIYNEYSGGSQDPVALRDFIRQVFFASSTLHDTLRYVLLFGNASYDYRGRLGYKSSFVPTNENGATFNPTQIYTDEFFFTNMYDTMSVNSSPASIGIGRIPARNQVEASVINRIMQYNTSNTFGSWRTRFLAICDEGDHNTHFRQADTLATRIENNECSINLGKIYTDAFPIDTTTTPYSFPDAANEINWKLNLGSLANMYTGHGGPLGWSFSNILDSNSILNTDNNNRAPLFISTTNAFNLFDDPQVHSCGQIVSTSANSCGIASISMTRLAFSMSNYNLEYELTAYLYNKQNNQYLRLGDLMRIAQNFYYQDIYTKSFCLLGDPALRLNYPEYNVVTTSLNGSPVSSVPDTLIPGQSLPIAGEIHDASGNVLTNFNGMIEILLFDQKTQHFTLGNNTVTINTVLPFYVWDDTLSLVQVPVTNGIFSTTLNLPFNIDSGSGIGKISYYATDSITDAWGCYENFLYKNLNASVNEIPEIKVLVYPNPSHFAIDFVIEGSREDFYFTLYDNIGKLIRIEKISSNRFTLLRNEISSGVYHYRLETKEKKVAKEGKIVFE